MAIHQNSPKLGNVVMETWKSGIADFDALFGIDGQNFPYQMAPKLQGNKPTNFMGIPKSFHGNSEELVLECEDVNPMPHMMKRMTVPIIKT